MRTNRTFALVLALSLVVGLAGVCSGTSARAQWARAAADQPGPVPFVRLAGGYDARAPRRARFIAKRHQYRRISRTYEFEGYVYRCRRFSFQCFRRPAYSSTSITYEHGEAETLIQVEEKVLPARLVRRPIGSDFSQPAGPSKAGLEHTGFYDGERVRIYDRSGGFVRISSPGRSMRWVRSAAVIGD